MQTWKSELLQKIASEATPHPNQPGVLCYAGLVSAPCDSKALACMDLLYQLVYCWRLVDAFKRSFPADINIAGE